MEKKPKVKIKMMVSMLLMKANQEEKEGTEKKLVVSRVLPMTKTTKKIGKNLEFQRKIDRKKKTTNSIVVTQEEKKKIKTAKMKLQFLLLHVVENGARPLPIFARSKQQKAATKSDQRAPKATPADPTKESAEAAATSKMSKPPNESHQGSKSKANLKLKPKLQLKLKVVITARFLFHLGDLRTSTTSATASSSPTMTTSKAAQSVE